MENHEMVQTAAHQLRQFTMARANKPLYKCPIHRINLSITTSVAMVTDMAIKRGECEAIFSRIDDVKFPMMQKTEKLIERK